MNVRAFAVALAFCAAGPLRAADPQLLNLVMPSPTVLAGVNVEQARATPFGLWALGQLQAKERDLQEFAALTGFDPRRDLREILVASAAPAGTRGAGLAMARGSFDVARIAAAAAQKQAAVTVYDGATLIDVRGGNVVAFVDSTLALAGPAGEVRAALDRRRSPAPLAPDLAAKVSQWSGTQDAWVVSLVPPPVPPVPDPRLREPASNIAGRIEQASAGVKFGADVRLTAEALAATEQDATNLAEVVRLLALLAQSSPNLDPEAGSLLQDLQVTAEARLLKLALSVPEETFERIVKMPRRAKTAQRRQLSR